MTGRLQVSLQKRFMREDGAFLLDVEFAVDAGFTILFGASGAGKTTLLNCIAGLEAPDRGRLRLGDALVFDSQNDVNVPTSRRAVGYLLQSLALFPHMTVEQNAHYGLHELEKAEREQRTGEILESFRIASLAKRRPREFRRRTSTGSVGPHPGYTAAGVVARRAFERAGCTDEIADCRRPARMESRASDSNPVCHPSARRSVRAR